MYELEALITEREGMIAENKQREYLGQAMAYVEDSFLILADKIRAARQSVTGVPKCPPGRHQYVSGMHCSVCGEKVY